MPEPFRVLVVCLGNVCRSPLAEGLLRARLGSAAPSFEVSSAGVLAMAGHPMDAHAAAELSRLGGDPRGLVGTQLTPAMVQRADLVLTATRQIRSRVLEDAPRALRRTFTLRELAALVDTDEVTSPAAGGPAGLVERAAACRSAAALDDYDVLDPIGRDAAVHREVADVVDTCCTRIGRALLAASG